MSSDNLYRNNAEDCLRMAQAAVNDGDRPFWLTLAQSWLRLAERASRGDERDQPGVSCVVGRRVLGYLPMFSRHHESVMSLQPAPLAKWLEVSG